LTYEQLLAQEHARFNLLHYDDELPINPTYRYTIGEEVCYGNLSKCHVQEILDGGLKLHISFHDIRQRYGTPYDLGIKPRIVWWHDLSPVSKIQDTHFARPRIRSRASQTMLGCLIDTTYYHGLIDNPDYQRGYVWTLADKQSLVRSIFNRVDIGKFVFVEYPHGNHRLEVVDGKQRLAAIREFVEGRFEFVGKDWYQLSIPDRFAFGALIVQTITLDAEYVKRSDILWLFLAINEGGVPQSEEHVAKARRLYEEAVRGEQQ